MEDESAGESDPSVPPPDMLSDEAPPPQPAGANSSNAANVMHINFLTMLFLLIDFSGRNCPR